MSVPHSRLKFGAVIAFVLVIFAWVTQTDSSGSTEGPISGQAHQSTEAATQTLHGDRMTSNPLASARAIPGPPSSAVRLGTMPELRERFPLPFPVRPPLDIYDFARLAPDACRGLGDDAALAHFAVLLGRVRISVQCEGPAGGAFDSQEAVGAFLWKHAPMWYVSSWSPTSWRLTRRQRVFVFAITGGSDGRAAFVERTWGQRTPIVWFADKYTPDLRPIVDLHPMYLKDKFRFLTFKISRIWQRVYEDYGSGAYNWYIRLWDDNYFYEEALHNTLGRLDPSAPLMAGKIGWRYMSDTAIFPFAGGGAGWFLSKAGLERIGPSIADAEKWFVEFRRRRDIFLPHDIHDEDVFLTAWFHLRNITFINIPGVEHVSPGLGWRQRCLDDATLHALRWDPNTTIYFNYPAREPQFRIENATYAYTKPLVWHYMSPSRLVTLETLLYPHRKSEFVGPIPRTASDQAKPKRKCYPGTPMPLPLRGESVFETELPDPAADNA